MHIQQTLISTVEANASLSKGEKGIVVAHVGVQDHHATVEAVRPANIRDSCKLGVHPQELVGRPQDDHIGIEVDHPPVLGLFP